MKSAANSSTYDVLVFKSLHVLRKFHIVEQGILSENQIERYVLGLLFELVDLVSDLPDDPQEHA